MKRIVVLGAGRVGGAVAADLAADGFEITVADSSPVALERAASRGASRAVRADLADPAAVAELASGHDLAVGAVPGPLGFRTLRAVIESGTPCVDIAFFEEDPFALDQAARERGVTALVDCGVAPGLSNLVLGHHAAAADRVESFACYVGGLPVRREGIFEYKAPFSPVDVIAEYTRPARFVAGGEIRAAPALSGVEEIDFPGVGALEAFLTDGLRSLLTTVDVPEMVEKTMRYPGHARQMELLRDVGLFDAEPVEVDGVRVRPVDLTARLLFPLWQFEPGEPDLTAMRVVVEETTGGTRSRHTWELLDRHDAATDTSSMARTTGYTCAAVVRRVARGEYARPGVSPPEYVAREPGCFERVREDLVARGIEIRETVDVVDLHQS